MKAIRFLEEGALHSLRAERDALADRVKALEKALGFAASELEWAGMVTSADLARKALEPPDPEEAA